LLSRLWTYCTARLELTMLYEVSFSTTRFSHTKKYPRQKPVQQQADNTTAMNLNLGKRVEV
jgi:hypothetical protein